MPKLTKNVVDAAKPAKKDYFVWCAEIKGFGVRIWPTGRKVYYADYYPKEGRRKRIKIGDHYVLTTAQARKEAVIILASVLKGGDPREERRTRRTSLTVAELCDDYLLAATKGLILGKGGIPKKQSTIDTDRVRIERHIKPLLGAKLVKEVSRADTSKFIRDVTAGKTGKGGAGTATRTTGLLGGILSHAVVNGIIDINPVHGVKKPAYNKRTRRLTSDEYHALGQALTSAIDQSDQVRLGCWLICLTGCRLGEVANLKWTEVDFEGHCLRLEDSKEGASVRPVGQVVLDTLSTHNQGRAYVVPAARGTGGFSSLGNAFIRMTKAAGLSGVTAHTMRHSFSSVADDLGLSHATIDSLTGHSDTSMTGRYIHKLDGTLISAADTVAGAIYEMMTGEPG